MKRDKFLLVFAVGSPGKQAKVIRLVILVQIALMLLSGAAFAEDPQAIIRVGTKPSEIVSTKITVSDLRRSYDFYTKVIGLQQLNFPGMPEPILDDPNIEYTDVKLNFSGSPADPCLILRKQKGIVPREEFARLTWLVIKVVNVRETVKKVQEMGLPVQIEPQVFMGAEISVINDPDGYVIELVRARAVGD